MTESYDDVSKIHKRYSLTLLNPSSYYHSLLFSNVSAAIISAIVVFVFLARADEAIFRLPAVIIILLITQYVDSRFIKNKEYSKSLHMSLFGNLAWIGVILAGILASIVLSKDLSAFYVVEGMFIFASFRIGILTTTLGTTLKRAWLLCFLQPMAMYLTLVPTSMWIPSLLDPLTLAVGGTFLVTASIWSVVTDRAGRPAIQSTHKMVQAYLASLSKNNPSEVESILESISTDTTVLTTQIRLQNKEKNNDFRLVLPEIHPGPFHPIGGSNIPYQIYKIMNSSAMVMHSVSDHSLNLPSRKEVENYLTSLSENVVPNHGLVCTEPITVQVNNSRVLGFLFEKSALLFLSLSPHGMEDIPIYVKTEIEQFAKNRNFERILIVDCHNAMGEEISEPDSEDMLKAAKSALDTLITKEKHPLEFGYGNSDNMNLNSPDLGLGGVGVLCLKINNTKYFLGWADSNNMENGVREYIVNHFAKNNLNLLEICTSDTHYSATKVRTRQGYYQFGKIAKSQDIAEWYLNVAHDAEKKLAPASFEILEHKADVKIMGSTVYEDYSRAVDNSLKITKGFAIGSFIFFIATLFL